MKRNKSIDIVRAIAILAVVVYHVFAITGQYINITGVQRLITYGGIYGVSIFFILSGYGIYMSLRKSEEKGEKFEYFDYLKKRFKRIAPQYYFSLSILLLFTGNVLYLSLEHILNLFSHLFFFHNLYYSLAGAISGVCWTLGVIMQFYLIAPILYKWIREKPKTVLLISFVVSVLFKYIIFHFILAPASDTNLHYYFTYGRQIITSIDHFVLGMFISQLLIDRKQKTNKKVSFILIIISLISLYGWLMLESYNNIPFINNQGIYKDGIMGYFWLSVLAIILGVLIYNFSKLELKFKSMPSKILLFISKYEYGIYIWNLIIIENLSRNSPIIQTVMQKYPPIILYGFFIVLSIIVGYIMTQIIDSFDYGKLVNIVKKNSNYLIKIGLIIVVILIVYKTIPLIKPTVINLSRYVKGEVRDERPSKTIADHSKKIINNSGSCRYIYIDTEETGYLYFYHLRYYLAPCESLSFNNYYYIINYQTSEKIYQYLKDIEVDYYLIRDNKIIEEELGFKINSDTGEVFKKNKKSTSLKDLFIKVENH